MTKLCPVLGKFMREVDVKVCEKIDLSHDMKHYTVLSPHAFTFYVQCPIKQLKLLCVFQILLKSFLPNLKSESAMKRRTSASALNCICLNSRNQNRLYAWLLNILLGLFV